jgi:hypothetical protein
MSMHATVTHTGPGGRLAAPHVIVIVVALHGFRMIDAWVARPIYCYYNRIVTSNYYIGDSSIYEHDACF